MTATEPTSFLSSDWTAALVAICATGAAPEGERVARDLEVDQIVTGGPDGDVVVRYRLVGGRVDRCEVVAGKTPPAPKAEVVLTTPHRDALALVRGELDLNAAFMAGQMKVAGATGPLLDLLAWSQRPEVSAWREALSAATD